VAEQIRGYPGSTIFPKEMRLMTPFYRTIRALRDSLVEVRGSPTLPAKQVQHIEASIAHVAAVLSNSDGDHPLTCMYSDDDEQQNSRRTQKTETSDTNTNASRSLRTELAEIRGNKPKPPPATASELAWSLIRSRGTR
jgi:hypothetical protein